MSFPFPHNCNLPGQKVSITFQGMERLRLEHNSKPLKAVFDSARLAFDTIVPVEYHGLSLKVLHHFWKELLPGIPESMQEEATNKKNIALQSWKEFNLYQRENFGPRYDVAQNAMLQALKDCEDDTAHNPQAPIDFDDIGGGRKKLRLPSSKNESSNIAFVRRAMKNMINLPEDDPYKEAILEAWGGVKDQARAQAHKARGTLDPNGYGGYWDINIDEILAGTPLPELPDPPQDLAGDYTEVDTGGNRLQNIVSSDYDFVAVPRTEEILLYLDKGVDFFSGDFEHLFDGQQDAATNRGFFIAWGLANIIGNRKDITDTSEDALLGTFGRTGSGVRTLQIQEINNGSIFTDAITGITLGKRYYQTPKRVGTAFTNALHNDVDRTSPINTLSLTLHDTVNFRYHYAAMSLNDGTGGATVTGNAGNYDFQIAAAAGRRRRMLVGGN